MSKSVSGSVFYCLLSFVLSAQDSYRLKNTATGTYLHTESGWLQATTISEDWKSAQWQTIEAGDGYVRIKNMRDSTFLNIENGSLASTPIRDGWLSALWTIKKTSGTNTTQIYNAWKPALYINMNNGLACSAITSSPAGANWEWEAVAGATPQIDSSQTKPDSNTPSSTGFFNIQKILDVHNAFRSEVGVQPLVWSEALAAKAQKWANYLAAKNRGNTWVLEHSGPAENLAGGYKGFYSVESPVTGWGNEKANFNTATKQCFGGKVCGHYTQMIWKNTTQVGCAITVNADGKYILVCNYDPAGNVAGQTAY